MGADLFTDKYAPKNLDEFIGNVEIVDTVVAWAKAWQEGTQGKPLLLFGQSGAGKTALAHLIAKQEGWQLFEMNASDVRDKESIEKIAGAAAGNSSLFGGKRLLLLDEVDGLQSQDRGGAGAIASIIKSSANPVILTANDVYGEKKLLPLRSICVLLEFRKINYLSIAKRLREIATIEGMTYEDEAIKELAKNSGGDFRSALLDVQSLAPTITMKDVQGFSYRQRKEKIFSVMSKIFKGKNIKEIQDAVNSSEVEGDLLKRWVEENIARQFDAEDSAKAFDVLSRSDVFDGRITRRQHYGFLRYSFLLATAGVGLARSKDYHSWTPFQFPSLLSSLSTSSSKREMRKKIANKIGEKLHCSRKQVFKDWPFIELLFTQPEKIIDLTLFFGFDEDELAFMLKKKADDKKVVAIFEETEKRHKQMIAEKIHGKQKTLFG